MAEVDLLIHHTVGGEARITTLARIFRADADGLINGLGGIRAGNGYLIVSTTAGISAAIPAQSIELIEVKRR